MHMGKVTSAQLSHLLMNSCINGSPKMSPLHLVKCRTHAYDRGLVVSLKKVDGS